MLCLAGDLVYNNLCLWLGAGGQVASQRSPKKYFCKCIYNNEHFALYCVFVFSIFHFLHKKCVILLCSQKNNFFRYQGCCLGAADSGAFRIRRAKNNLRKTILLVLQQCWLLSCSGHVAHSSHAYQKQGWCRQVSMPLCLCPLDWLFCHIVIVTGISFWIQVQVINCRAAVANHSDKSNLKKAVHKVWALWFMVRMSEP